MRMILFVCTGNSCRSVIAENLFNKYSTGSDLDYYAYSCGTSASPTYHIPEIVVSLLKIDDIELFHTPTQIDAGLVRDAHLILAMEKRHKEYIKENFHNCVGKTFLLKEFIGEEGEIYDPIGLPKDEYIKRYNEIKECVIKLIEKLKLISKNNHGELK